MCWFVLWFADLEISPEWCLPLFPHPDKRLKFYEKISSDILLYSQVSLPSQSEKPSSHEKSIFICSLLNGRSPSRSL